MEHQHFSPVKLVDALAFPLHGELAERRFDYPC